MSCVPGHVRAPTEMVCPVPRQGQGGELRGRELVDRLKVLRALREARTQLREDPVLFPLLYPIIQALEKCDADWVITL